MDNLLVFSKSLLIAYFPHKIKLKAHNYTKINPLLLITHNKSHNILYFMQVKSINIHKVNLAKLNFRCTQRLSSNSKFNYLWL
ncbi:hypothetical protein A7X13_02910 [Helicobacter pullorum]|nr:hypothetical protein A7X13_02910 [Helicobacter pullorum]